eukprot:gb/GEZN01009832.1/.p1 GENE.gb/GEZN01009832.1/~~gb/GEZN01009832.1/.p1  ORF type:complete len:378 (+),score=58.16 gb/GEZN01009832.1/:25-1158(+)
MEAPASVPIPTLRLEVVQVVGVSHEKRTKCFCNIKFFKTGDIVVLTTRTLNSRADRDAQWGYCVEPYLEGRLMDDFLPTAIAIEVYFAPDDNEEERKDSFAGEARIEVGSLKQEKIELVNHAVILEDNNGKKLEGSLVINFRYESAEEVARKQQEKALEDKQPGEQQTAEPDTASAKPILELKNVAITGMPHLAAGQELYLELLCSRQANVAKGMEGKIYSTISARSQWDAREGVVKWANEVFAPFGSNSKLAEEIQTALRKGLAYFVIRVWHSRGSLPNLFVGRVEFKLGSRLDVSANEKIALQGNSGQGNPKITLQFKWRNSLARLEDEDAQKAAPVKEQQERNHKAAVQAQAGEANPLLADHVESGGFCQCTIL